MRKHLMQSVSSGVLRLVTQQRMFEKRAVFIRRAPDLDEVVAGQLYTMYQVQDEFGHVVFFFSGGFAEVFEAARQDQYVPHWLH